MDKLEITYMAPSLLKLRERTLRKRHPHQLSFLKRSIAESGFNEPVLRRGLEIVHGEARVIAATEFGLKTIPTIEISHLTPAQVRAYAIAANQIGTLAGFDDEALRIELCELKDLDVDLTSLGFQTAELDIMLGITDVEADSRLDQIPPVAEGPPISKLGDLWLLGKRQHRLIVADALSATSYDALLGADRAHMILTDPPYNDPVRSISGNGKVKHREFVQASGELTEDQFTRFMTNVCRHMRAYSVDGSLHFIFMSWRHLLALLRAGHIVYDELKNIICWVKQSGGMGALYRSRSEYICVFKAGTASHTNNMLLGKYGRNRTNVWDGYGGLNNFQPERTNLLALHPSVKPVELIADAMLDCSKIDDLILDPFAGTGTIFLAAEKTHRRAAGMELDPLYADVCLRRFRNVLGIDPVHALSGRTLAECEAEANLSAISEVQA